MCVCQLAVAYLMFSSRCRPCSATDITWWVMTLATGDFPFPLAPLPLRGGVGLEEGEGEGEGRPSWPADLEEVRLWS